MGEKKHFKDPGPDVWYSVAPGVEEKYLEGESGKKKDRKYCYRINFSVRGKRYGYYILGWSNAGGWTRAKAEEKRAYYKNNAYYGREPWNPRQEGEQLEEALRQKQEEAEQKKRERITFSEVWEEHYFKNDASSKTNKSWELEETFYRNYIKPIIGDIPLIEIEEPEIQKVRKAMKGKSARSQYYAVCIIRQLFNKAIKKGLYPYQNPVQRHKEEVVPAGANRQRTGILKEDEEKQLFEALWAKSELMHDVALMSLYSGMRFSEVARMRWQDIDWQENKVVIYNAKDPSNPEKTRFAWFRAKARQMLERRFQNSETDLVFPGKNGAVMQSVPKTFDRTVKELKLNENRNTKDRIVFYSLRHSFATRLMNANVNSFMISGFLGHSSPGMTARYTHANPSWREALAELDKEN